MACLLGVSTISQQTVCIIFGQSAILSVFFSRAAVGLPEGDCEDSAAWPSQAHTGCRCGDTLPSHVQPRPLTRVKNTHNRLLMCILFTL